MATTGTFTLFDSTTLWVADGTQVLAAGHTVRIALCTSAEALTASNAVVYADLSAELATGNGYVLGGVAISSFAIARSGSVVTWTFAGPTPKWAATGTGIPAWRWFVMYVDGTLNGQVKPLIGFALGDPSGIDVPLTPAGTSLDLVGPQIFSFSPPTSSQINAWVAKPLPVSDGSVIFCDAQYFSAIGAHGGGKKHGTMIFCPVDNRTYIFGGDGGGYSSYAEQAAGIPNASTGADFRNDEWSYEPITNNWRLEKGWDCGTGKIQPWRPDWGMFAYDTKRNVIWFMPGGSNGAWGGGAGAPFYVTGKAGLQFSYNRALLLPDPTVIAAGTLTLADNSTNYVEYNPTTHTVSSNTSGFTGGSVIALYTVPTSGGVIGTQTDMRPYWMQYGLTVDDNIDFRHYGHPLHLIYRDMTTGLWTDPGLAAMGTGTTLPNSLTSGGNPAPAEGRNFCMIYDQGGDQLVFWAAGSGLTTSMIHYSFATNTWSRFHTGCPQTQLSQCIYCFNEVDRLIYAIEATGDASSGVYPLQGAAWTYSVDNHTWSSPMPVPDCQSGTVLWAGHGFAVGTPVGGGLSFAQCKLDSANEIIWWPETTNSLLCPYGYENDGWLQKLHAWHYRENRWEIINAPDPVPGAHPHGIQHGFDPVNNLYLMYGENSGNDLNPAAVNQYMYQWRPSGFTKRTWSAMP